MVLHEPWWPLEKYGNTRPDMKWVAYLTKHPFVVELWAMHDDAPEGGPLIRVYGRVSDRPIARWYQDLDDMLTLRCRLLEFAYGGNDG